MPLVARIAFLCLSAAAGLVAAWFLAAGEGPVPPTQLGAVSGREGVPASRSRSVQAHRMRQSEPRHESTSGPLASTNLSRPAASRKASEKRASRHKASRGAASHGEVRASAFRSTGSPHTTTATEASARTPAASPSGETQPADPPPAEPLRSASSNDLPLKPELPQPPLRQQIVDLSPNAAGPAANDAHSTRNSLPQPAGSSGTAARIRLRDPQDDDEQRLEIVLQDTDLREALELLSKQGGLNIIAGPSVQGKVSASLVDVTVDEALDAILRSTGYQARREGAFVYVGSPQDFVAMEAAGDRISTRLYRPNYVTAKDLQDLIAPLLTPPPVGKVSVTAPAEQGIKASGDASGGNSYAASEAVLVQDYERVLVQIDRIVAEMDVQPAQVAIEAMILSVKLDDQFKFGVDFQLLRDREHVRFGWNNPRINPLNGSGTVNPATGGIVGEFAFDTGGLKFAFLDSNLGVFLDALETIGDTNVVATPRLMCLNKQRAEILIGNQLGYVSTTQTSTSTTQSVSFLEVGAQLRLRPFISDDGMIRLEIHPELSTGEVRVEGGFTLPNKDVTQVTTNIMVPDGCTLVIGGLMRDQLSTSTSQVPFMGSLPWVGFLFRRKNERIERRELLVLVTPHVITPPDMCHEGARRGLDYLERQQVYADHMSPLGRRHVSRSLVRRSRQMLAMGRPQLALRLADLAVHFDPVNQEAVSLRGQIASQSPETRRAAEAMRPLSHPLDDTYVAPWLLEEIEFLGAHETPLETESDVALPREPVPAGQQQAPGEQLPLEMLDDEDAPADLREVE